ncbi:MAG: hypothetical protein GXZ11_09260 [Tissierellia bacterium]|nr:hypothetical protein [Tissierellia bacterium]
MLINSKYKFTNTKSRSVYEIISEDGEMSRRDILYVIKQVCQIEDIVQYGEFIHPRNIMINTNGVVTLVKSELPFSTREAYIPPENDRFDTIKPSAILYALGITMLFMATGNERKTGLDSHQDDNQLFRLIQTCIDFDIKARL